MRRDAREARGWPTVILSSEGWPTTPIPRMSSKQLGEPDSVISIQDPDDPDVELLAWAYPELAVSLGEEGVRYGVTLTGPGISTSRGLHTGDPQSRTIELYGRPQHREGDTWDYIAPDDENGLHVMRVRFEHGRVSWIFLGWLME